jgi:hypothetical protein
MSARRPWSSQAWLRQARSGRWPFLFAEIALYDLVVLAATGIYLAVFFNPSMTQRAALRGGRRGQPRMAVLCRSGAAPSGRVDG